jgi:hypothetical protein
MRLETVYLGFRLPHPLVPGASPLADEMDGVRRLEDAGAPMIVLRSLFEEQLVHEQLAGQRGIDEHENLHPTRSVSGRARTSSISPASSVPSGFPSSHR